MLHLIYFRDLLQGSGKHIRKLSDWIFKDYVEKQDQLQGEVYTPDVNLMYASILV